MLKWLKKLLRKSEKSEVSLYDRLNTIDDECCRIVMQEVVRNKCDARAELSEEGFTVTHAVTGKVLRRVPFCPDDCENLSPKEAEESQTCGKGMHRCRKYGVWIRHQGFHPKLVRAGVCIRDLLNDETPSTGEGEDT